MKTWLNEGTPPPGGAVESWQPGPSETRSATPRAAIGRRLHADMAGLDTFPQRTRADSQRSLRSEEHTSELQSRPHLVCRLLLEKKKYTSGPFHRRASSDCTS